MKKIEDINLDKLNNAEFTLFSGRTVTHVDTATPAALGLTQPQVDEFADGVSTLTDIVAQSKISDETEDIKAVDAQCDSYIVYLNSAIKTAKSSPIAEEKTAATHLYNIAKPYVGIQKLARGQQIQQTRGYLADLGKPENAAAVSVLGLGPTVQLLRQANNRYAQLLDERAASQQAAKLEPGKAVREKMNVQYDDIVTMAFVTSVSRPSAAADAFVDAMNKLIADTNTAYNQRIAQLHAHEAKKKKKQEEEGNAE